MLMMLKNCKEVDSLCLKMKSDGCKRMDDRCFKDKVLVDPWDWMTGDLKMKFGGSMGWDDW